MAEIRRVVRVPLDLGAIDALDDLVRQGVGGYASREELIRDAVNDKVLELHYGLAPPAEIEQTVSAAPIQRTELAAEQGLESTGLDPVRIAFTVETDTNIRVDSGPLYGLHNRDYPTLWSLRRLAHHAETEAARFEDFVVDLGDEAWQFAARLQGLQNDSGLKLDALYPKNPSKAKSAEAVFRDHAVGVIRREADSLFAYGPFFQWRAAGIDVRGEDIFVGLTRQGLRLLNNLAGLSLDLPHHEHETAVFIDYLRNEAPGDWAGFLLVMRLAVPGISRPDLVDEFVRYGAETLGREWTEKTAASYATGYVARCREWGLLKPKQANGLYVLTEFGTDQVKKEESYQ